jgi:hypothetical protein
MEWYAQDPFDFAQGRLFETEVSQDDASVEVFRNGALLGWANDLFLRHRYFVRPNRRRVHAGRQRKS